MSAEVKRALRKEAAARRKEVHAIVDQSAAQDRLQSYLEATEGPVSFYWPIRSEIDPRPTMAALHGAGRTVGLPMTHGHAALTFRLWEPGVPMERDGFGVEVPADDRAMVPAVLVVPLLAFDARGHRLGYGAGHYDRTLDCLRRTGPRLAVGFAFAAQQVEGDLPNEETDQPLDAVITELTTIMP